MTTEKTPYVVGLISAGTKMVESMFYAATHEAECPKCGALKGSYCAGPSGRKARYPHKERMREFKETPGFNVDRFTVTAIKASDLFNLNPRTTKFIIE